MQKTLDSKNAKVHTLNVNETKSTSFRLKRDQATRLKILSARMSITQATIVGWAIDEYLTVQERRLAQQERERKYRPARKGGSK